MGYNKFIGMGRMTRDAELKQTSNGLSVISFNVAIDRDIKSQDGTAVDFVDCTAWRKTAEHIGRYFHKGDMIHIEGSLQSRKFTDKNDVKRTVWEIQVDRVSFCGTKTEQTAQQAAAVDRIKENISDYPTNDLPGDDDLPF
jgi:single-strand DNA-binding protein